MIYYAHINANGEKQLLRDHCRNTAEIAGRDLEDVGLANAAYLAGLLHDMGKYTTDFQDYLNGTSSAKRGEVIHTFQGCRYIFNTFREDVNKQSAAEIIAYAIAAHHGTFDCVDENGRVGLIYRSKEGEDAGYEAGYKESLRAFFEDCASEKEIAGLFEKAVEEIKEFETQISVQTEKDDEFYFLEGFIARLLSSAVIDGDRKDTAEFMNGIRADAGRDLNFWDRNLLFMEDELAKMDSDTPIARERQSLSEKCRRYAEEKGGVIRLSLPTGAGKTLSSLRYALAHAAKFHKQRLILVTPLLAIIDQNSEVIKAHIADKKMILEHHSNVISEQADTENRKAYQLDTQTWDAPIIVTTLVQFLNTIFAGKTSNVRRFRALCNSVIVIDEVQTVPSKMVSLFNLAIRFLSKWCRATVVLCSATQPCTEKMEHQICEDIADMVPYDPKIWSVFRRTEIVPVYGQMRLSEIARFAEDQLKSTDSLLVVCNTRKEAEELFKMLKGADAKVFHLSASMCTEHRRDVISEIRRSLSTEKTLCISTQVIEAGVDISFRRVIRLTAGMDGIAQAAGRCNRNGEFSGIGKVYVVDHADEYSVVPGDIGCGQTAARELISLYRTDAQKFDGDLISEKSIRSYYNKFFSQWKERETCFYLKEKNASIFELLSMNENYSERSARAERAVSLKQAFRTAGDGFRVFDDDTVELIVPYIKGRDLIREIFDAETTDDIITKRSIINRAKAYSVSVRESQYEKLQEAGAVITKWGGDIRILKEDHYDPATGVLLSAGTGVPTADQKNKCKQLYKKHFPEKTK